MNTNTILTNTQFNHITNRIAYQIYETFEDELRRIPVEFGIEINDTYFP